MKLLITLCFSLINSVAFLFYLSTVNTFLPLSDLQEYNWDNIATVVVLFCVAIFSLLALLISFGQLIWKRKMELISWKTSIKYAGVITLFLLILGTLYFFHIFTWYWVLCTCVLLGILIITV